MTTRIPPDISQQKVLINCAQNAATSGDYLTMLQCLFDSMLLEGFERHFTSKFPVIGTNEVHDQIGIATDDLCKKISKGERVGSIENYLYKVINNKLARRSAEKKRLSELSNTHENLSEPDFESEDQKEQSDEYRERLLKIIEGLVPRLKFVNGQNVMRYILEAVRNGAHDVPSTEIADALGLTSTNVRQAKKRAFDRLARIVKEENLIDKSYEFPFLQELQEYRGDGLDD